MDQNRRRHGASRRYSEKIESRSPRTPRIAVASNVTRNVFKTIVPRVLECNHKEARQDCGGSVSWLGEAGWGCTGDDCPMGDGLFGPVFFFFVTLRNEISQLPNVIRNSSGHRWSHAKGPMNQAEVIGPEI
jgi:hypothetical protein